jgi:hypothetical protein
LGGPQVAGVPALMGAPGFVRTGLRVRRTTRPTDVAFIPACAMHFNGIEKLRSEAKKGRLLASAVQACNSMGVQKRLMSSRPRDGA